MFNIDTQNLSNKELLDRLEKLKKLNRDTDITIGFSIGCIVSVIVIILVLTIFWGIRMTKTIMIGNTTIMGEDIDIIGVNEVYDMGGNQHTYSVEIQITRKIINDNGYVDIIYKNDIYPCSEDEYDTFKEMLYG